MPTSILSLKDRLTKAQVGTTLETPTPYGSPDSCRGKKSYQSGPTYTVRGQAADLKLSASKDIMRSLYPLSARLLAHGWTELMGDYFQHHPPGEMKLSQLGRAFCRYLTACGGKLLERYPHLSDLADLEWTEVVIAGKQAGDSQAAYAAPSTTDELNRLGPVVNPALTLRTYNYPMPGIVQRLKSGIGLPEKIRPATTHLAIYKNPVSGTVDILELSGVVARMVTIVMDTPISYTKLIEMTAPLARQSDTVEAIVAILELVDKLQNLQIFVGSCAVPEPTRAI